ncbi:MAG TPA: hypothetical protein EYN70_07020 [Planctomycetaceae bacterium]|nr:hypothetical protein [Planctomycetaceae bacterium]
MTGTTICGLADGAAWPIKNTINKFRDAFETYTWETNPTGCDTKDPVPILEIIQHH